MENYWVFQGNPQYYRISDALKNNALKTWYVSQHKKEIKKGDKVIIWQTGDKAGIYALATIISDIYLSEKVDDDLEYYIKKSDSKPSNRVDILIDYNLAEKPLLKDYILSFSELKELNQGKQGTNFPSNKSQYNSILNLIEMSYYNELENFLTQSKTSNLKTSNYIKSFLGLSVKVGFGQGGLAKIPWISFLTEDQTTQNGIYPVYLLFKEKNILFLAYGISETESPIKNWHINDLQSINDYFRDNNLGKPFRYGNSLIFKIYNTNDLPKKEVIDNDLKDIISYYKSLFSEEPQIPNPPPKMKDFNNNSFKLALDSSKIQISIVTSTRFTASLLTKPFVILTGLSGSGKTKLAQAFAMWICENDTQYKIIPVGADWTNREPLLGFPNALQENKYVKPDSGALDLIIQAKENSGKPYFLILDEMNLSHVERYFADFLSAMESREAILLHAGKKDWDDVPPKIEIPNNLFIVGTVNIDETTYMFSPKVLDRANVIEFRVTENEMEGYLTNYKPLNMNALKAQGASMGEDFVRKASDKTLGSTNNDEITGTMLKFFIELKKSGAEFGYRSASEILRFAAVASSIEAEWTVDEIIDAAIMQKLLPKVHGSRNKLSKILPVLGGFCLKDAGKVKENYLENKEAIGFEEDKNVIYKLSFEKICRMYRNAVENGYASYAEA